MKYELKREIFDLYDNARVLFNDYYNGKENYSEEDFNEIIKLISEIEEHIKEVKYNVDILKD